MERATSWQVPVVRILHVNLNVWLEIRADILATTSPDKPPALHHVRCASNIRRNVSPAQCFTLRGRRNSNVDCTLAALVTNCKVKCIQASQLGRRVSVSLSLCQLKKTRGLNYVPRHSASFQIEQSKRVLTAGETLVRCLPVKFSGSCQVDGKAPNSVFIIHPQIILTAGIALVSRCSVEFRSLGRVLRKSSETPIVRKAQRDLGGGITLLGRQLI